MRSPRQWRSASSYVERKPEVTDRRAKLIYPTARGRQALRDARDRVVEIEQHWSGIVGPERFPNVCRTLQDLVDALNGPPPKDHSPT